MKQAGSSAAPKPYIRARAENILTIARKHGIEGDSAIAAAFGVSRATAWRVLRRDALPPAEFLAGALASIPGAQFEDLFDVIDPRRTDVPR